MGIVAWTVLALFLASAIWLLRVIFSPELKYHSFWYKVKAAIIFWFGDIRRIRGFPWMTWAPKCHGMTFRDVREGSAACRPGDIGLHRDWGYASNLGIPGAFKHAWICVEDHYCVEALSEGVLKRDDMAPLLSDYAVILRPRGVTQQDRDEAVERANALVGSAYDANFKFDFEASSAIFSKGEMVRRMARDFRNGAADNLKGGKAHFAFSCTEVAGFSWYHRARELRIFRVKHAGRPAIIADNFLQMNFDIVYASPSVTERWARQAGLHEEGIDKISDYWASKMEKEDKAVKEREKS